MENLSMSRRHVVYIEVESRLKEIISHAVARQGFVTGIKKALYLVHVGFCFFSSSKRMKFSLYAFYPN